MQNNSSNSSFDLLYDDDFYFAALFDDDDLYSGDQDFQLSDEKYAHELQLQEALISSAAAGAVTVVSSASASCSSSTSSVSVAVLVAPVTSALESSSEDSLRFCEICVETKESDQMFKSERCLHSFCSDCIAKHAATKLNESLTVAISCPSLDCGSLIELDACRTILTRNVVERWEDALCEAVILASEKLYCPFNDCSAVMIVDEDELITESECPICHRLFCAQCKVPWHPGIECEDYRRLNEDERGRDDLMARELARENKWMRCPHCKYFVEKTEGCLHITCRCTFEFCYACGSNWSSTHGGCQPN